MAIFTRIASDGKPIEMTDRTFPDGKTKLSIIKPTMARDISRAGKTVKVQPCWEVEYDENGYAVKCTNVGGNVKAPARNLAFRNEAVKEGWKDCVASSDDGAEFTLYDASRIMLPRSILLLASRPLTLATPMTRSLLLLCSLMLMLFLLFLASN